jgi:hypothetical protein
VKIFGSFFGKVSVLKKICIKSSKKSDSETTNDFTSKKLFRVFEKRFFQGEKKNKIPKSADGHEK